MKIEFIYFKINIIDLVYVSENISTGFVHWPSLLGWLGVWNQERNIFDL